MTVPYSPVELAELEMMTIPFPLTDGHTAYLTLPRVLSVHDAARIADALRALALCP